MKNNNIIGGRFKSLVFMLTGMIAINGWTASPDGPEDGGMPMRPLGRTGYSVALFSLGGQATIERRGQDEKAHEIINRALDLGVNYIDTAPSYGGGISETYIGRVMRDRRDEVFLATKSHDYSYAGTMRLIEQSLQRLQTDRIDLYQHHNVGSLRQLERITAEDGALRAFLELQERGVVKHIGITSHSPRVLLRALELDVYDCMLITLNPAGASMQDRGYLEAFMEKAREREVGVIAMKVVGRGTLVGGRASMKELLRYALSFPVATAVIGISEVWQVDDNVGIASDFEPLPTAAKRELESRFR